MFGTGSPAFWTSLAVLWIFLILGVVSSVEARSSAAWRERLEARTATLWIDGQALEGIVLNARGELNVTWVGRDLIRPLDQDRDVEEWLVSALGYYFSNRKDTRAKVKGRDVFVLNYRAVKYWNFDATRLVVDGYAITPDDILTKKEYWQDGELPPGYMGTVAVAAPSPKPGRKIELRFEDAQAILEVPRR
ncbi:MAG: hypothetical protein LBO68_04185 [Synergistaceae bacterium]|nr:hypothetical protein [Synergistaceae bacterium]